MLASALTLLVAVTATSASVFELQLDFAPADLSSCWSQTRNGTPEITSDVTLQFSTWGVPGNHTCFNLNETFAANATKIQPYWAIEKYASFDPAANYSWVWYKQSDITSGANALKGKTNQMFVQLYPEYGCIEASDTKARPVYGTSCGSDLYGDCHQTAYNVQSFSIFNNSYEIDGKCLNFYREKSGAIGLAPRGWTILFPLLLVIAGVMAT